MLQFLIQQQLPTFEKNLNLNIEQLFTEIAEQEELNPFELSLFLAKVQDKAIARIDQPNKKGLRQIDMATWLQDTMEQQLALMPALVQNLVREQIQGQQIEPILLDYLSQNSLLLCYNEDLELLCFSINAQGQKEPVSIQDFLASLSV